MMVVSEANQLLATQIAYADLDAAMIRLEINGVGPIKLADAIKDAWAHGESISPLNKYLKSDGTFKDEYSFANEWTILAAINENKPGSTGLYSCILDTGEARILANRGSEDMSNMMNFKQDWYEADLQLLNSEMTKQEASLYKFMEANADLLAEKYWVATGHSLGGALADFAATMSAVIGIDNFSGAINFDGPGHSKEFIEKYETEIAQVSKLMLHKKASIVGYILFDFPGVKQEYIKTTSQSQFLDENGNPYKQTAKTIFDEHDTQYWVRNEDGSLCEGEQDWYEFLVEKITRGIDNMPSAIGNSLPHIIYLLVTGVNWLGNIVDDYPTLIKTMTVAAVSFLLANPAVTLLAIEVVASIVVIFTAFLIIVILGEMLFEKLEEIAIDIAKTVCLATSWLVDKVVELCNAIQMWINEVIEFLRSNSAGGRYASSNPYFRVDTAKLNNYAIRINNVNNRLRRLDGELRGLYWQVGFLDIWDIMVANSLTSGSPTLMQVKTYLDTAASRFENADNRACENMGG